MEVSLIMEVWQVHHRFLVLLADDLDALLLLLADGACSPSTSGMADNGSIISAGFSINLRVFRTERDCLCSESVVRNGDLIGEPNTCANTDSCLRGEFFSIVLILLTEEPPSS